MLFSRRFPAGDGKNFWQNCHNDSLQRPDSTTYITDTYIPTPALDAPFVTSPRHQKKTRARNPWLTPTDGGRWCTSFQGVGLLHLFSSCNLAFFLLAKFRTSQTAFFLRRGNPSSHFRVFSTCLLGLCLYNTYRNKAVFRKAIQKKPLHNYAGFNQSSSRTGPHPWYVQWYQYSAWERHSGSWPTPYIRHSIQQV